MRLRTGLLALVVAGSPALVGCTSAAEQGTACQTGAPSPTAAVSMLLDTATTGDIAAACKVTVKISDDDLRANLAEVNAHVESVGGRDKVTVVDVPDAQVGTLHLVDVLTVGSTEAVHFTVERADGRYLVVSPPSTPPDDEETTDPNPRPSPTATETSAA